VRLWQIYYDSNAGANNLTSFRWIRAYHNGNGIRGLGLDDYIMIVALLWYSLLIVMFYMIVNGGGSNLFPPEQLKSFDQDEIDARVLGSKLVVVSEKVR
jgi:hypothetical protein